MAVFLEDINEVKPHVFAYLLKAPNGDVCRPLVPSSVKVDPVYSVRLKLTATSLDIWKALITLVIR